MMSRRWFTALVVGALVLSTTAWAAERQFQGFSIVNVTLDGKVLDFEVPAVNFYGRTVLPLRALAELVGVDVEWDGATSTAHLSTRAKPVAVASSELSSAEILRIRGLDAIGFNEYLKSNFGVIGGQQLEFLGVRPDLFAFYISDLKQWNLVDHKARLSWVTRLSDVMSARFEEKPFDISLVLRLEYSFIPDSWPIDEGSFSESGKWVVRHTALSVRRSDLGSYGYGLQPITVVVE